MQIPPSPNSPEDPSGSEVQGIPDGGVRPGDVSIPDHTLLRSIGKGSYGEVWLARNIMGAYRAIKIVHRSSFEDRRPFDRELSGIRKFEPISRSHDGFMDVLHAGLNEAQGYFYYVMEIGDDEKTGQQIDPKNYSPRTLAKKLEPAGKLSAEDCLRLGLALSDALAELHKHGLVHRDIKASNIIFVNGTPKLADIGLVADMKEARSYVGTEGFIPPEGPGAPQADIYALGKVLYEAATGKDRHSFPELPATWDDSEAHQLLVELNEIILQACQTDLGKRYRTAWDMHANLLLVVNGKSVKRLKILERRLAKLKGLALISAPVLIVAAGIAYHFYREFRMQSEARQKEVGENIAYGTRAVETSDPSGALPYFAQALELDKGDAAREGLHRFRFGTTFSRCARIEYLNSLANAAGTISFSPDGYHVAVAERNGPGRIIDIVAGTSVTLSKGFLYRGAYNQDGTLLVTASGNGEAYIWEANTGRLLRTLRHTNEVPSDVPFVNSATFSQDGLHVVTGAGDNRARVWDVRTGNLERELKGHKDSVLYAAFSHDGSRIVTASRDGSARLWDAETGRQIGSPLGQITGWIMHAAFSPDDSQIVIADSNHRARVFDVARGQEILPPLLHDDLVESADFSPDGRYILTGSLDYTARLWSADGHQLLPANGILRQSGRVYQAAFDREGLRVGTACEDGTIRIMNLALSGVVPFSGAYSEDGSRFLLRNGDSVEVHDAVSQGALSPRMDFLPKVDSVRLNRNGRFVMAQSVIRTNDAPPTYILQIRNAVTGKSVGRDLTASNSLANAAVSDNGTRCATFNGRWVQVWDTASPSPAIQDLDHGEVCRAAFFPAVPDRLITWGTSQVSLWDTGSGQRVFGPLQHTFEVKGAVISPDGAVLLTWGLDSVFTHCPVQAWDSATGRFKFKIEHEDGIFLAAYDSTGGRIATASEDFSAAIWEASNGHPLSPPLKHGEKVLTVVFSRDGKWLLTASVDKTARIWNAATGEPLTPPLNHAFPLVSARFVGSGDQVLTLDDHRNQRLWFLSKIPRPYFDLRSLATLLSGGRVVPSGGLSLPRENAARAWERLRKQYPSDFVASQVEIANWHRAEAEQSEIEGQTHAVVFHLEYLAKLRPQDSWVAEHLAAARKKLNP